MIEVRGGQKNPDRLEPQTRVGDVIEAENMDEAWALARAKYYLPDPKGMMKIQIVNIVPGNVEVDPRVWPEVEDVGAETKTGGVAESSPQTNGGTESTVSGGD
jgi:hypothetical protein